MKFQSFAHLVRIISLKHKKNDRTLDQLMQHHIKEKTRTSDKEDVKKQQTKHILFKEKLQIRSPRTISQKLKKVCLESQVFQQLQTLLFQF